MRFQSLTLFIHRSTHIVHSPSSNYPFRHKEKHGKGNVESQPAAPAALDDDALKKALEEEAAMMNQLKVRISPSFAEFLALSVLIVCSSCGLIAVCSNFTIVNLIAIQTSSVYSLQFSVGYKTKPNLQTVTLSSLKSAR